MGFNKLIRSFFVTLMPLTVLVAPSLLMAEDAHLGAVGVFENGVYSTKTVPLPPFVLDQGRVKAALVTIRSDVFPNSEIMDLKPDAEGCYCYKPEDPRFAVIHTLYYATGFLEDYNGHLEKLGWTTIEEVNFTLEYNPLTSTDSRGIAGGGFRKFSVVSHYPGLAPDVTVLGHELGHHVYGIVKGIKSGTPMGKVINEGISHLFSVLHFRKTAIGEYDMEEKAFEMDTFVKFPELTTTIDN